MIGVIIYDSVFGNTEKVAQHMGDTLGEDVSVIKISNASLSDLEGLDYLLVGSPTRAFRPTKDISSFLKSIPNSGLNGVKVGAFDTRIDPADVNNAFLNLMVRLFGYADKPISNALVKKGGRLVLPNAGFVVLDSESPLREGELERAAKWVKGILE